MVWLVMGVSLAVMLLAGFPIGVALGLTGFLILELFVGGALQLGITAGWNAFNSFTLSAVPAFIVLGEVLLASGLGARIYSGVSPLFRRVPGGLMHTNVAVGTLFGAVSGTSLATAAAVGSVAYPQLIKRGYPAKSVVGILAASGTLGIIIPPSLILIIYGATMDVSIGKLFLAGLIPGFLLAAMFMGLVAVRARLTPGWLPDDREEVTLAVILRSLVELWPLAVLMFAVLGTIYMGIATPTEAASLGVVAAILLGFTVGELTMKGLLHALIAAVRGFGAIALIFLGASILSQAISILGLPAQLAQTMSALAIGKYELLLGIVLLYLILGCLFDGISIMLMTLPLTFPLMMNVGFDPVWYGIVVTILIEIGMITPPVGINLFVLVSLTKGAVNITEAAWEAIPYWLLMLVAIALFTLFPGIVTGLPNLFY